MGMMAPVYHREAAGAIQKCVGSGDEALLAAWGRRWPDCLSRSGRAGGGLWPEDPWDTARCAQRSGQESQQRLGLEEQGGLASTCGGAEQLRQAQGLPAAEEGGSPRGVSAAQEASRRGQQIERRSVQRVEGGQGMQ